jgi:hypothetical protein
MSVYHHESCESKAARGELYSIQHYVIKFFSDLEQVGGFLQEYRINKGNNKITELRTILQRESPNS